MLDLPRVALLVIEFVNVLIEASSTRRKNSVLWVRSHKMLLSRICETFHRLDLPLHPNLPLSFSMELQKPNKMVRWAPSLYLMNTDALVMVSL